MGTEYLLNYLKSDLTTIQLGLLAINTTTCGLIVSKLQEIRDKYPNLIIKPIIKQLLASLKEQVILIIIGVITLLILSSELVKNLTYCEYFTFILETILITVFVNSIQVLWDTGKAVFIIIEIMDDVNPRE